MSLATSRRGQLAPSGSTRHDHDRRVATHARQLRPASVFDRDGQRLASRRSPSPAQLRPPRPRSGTGLHLQNRPAAPSRRTSPVSSPGAASFSRTSRDPQIPIAALSSPAASPNRPRGFVPWRLPDAGPVPAAMLAMAGVRNPAHQLTNWPDRADGSSAPTNRHLCATSAMHSTSQPGLRHALSDPIGVRLIAERQPAVAFIATSAARRLPKSTLILCLPVPIRFQGLLQGGPRR